MQLCLYKVALIPLVGSRRPCGIILHYQNNALILLVVAWRYLRAIKYHFDATCWDQSTLKVCSDPVLLDLM